MLINEASKLTKLTKKAIEYYSNQGLISPVILENGYRDFSLEDIDILKRISVFRKLDISVEEIKNILNDNTNSTLQNILVLKEINYQRDLIKKSILQKLISKISYEEIQKDLQTIEQSETIINKLLIAFPGYFGRFICMHFSRFLNQPIQTQTQKTAYNTIILFLDNLPDLKIPKDLEEYLIENTKHLEINQISQMLEVQKEAYDNPDVYFENNKEMLNQYLEFKKSDEYLNSPAFKLMQIMKDFYSSSGYNDIFIPAMKELSPSYNEYFAKVEIANKILLEKLPEIKNLYN